MEYRRSNNSGLLVPAITLGLWHNFGTHDNYYNMIQMVQKALDHGITSFDLANNYGPEPGSAEENFGKILHSHFSSQRDEMLITTKAGHLMWNGPYGEWGTRKHLMASIDQSLRRMNIDYVDIFYSHRPDPNTPLEETMQALVDIVRSGKALYIGLSKYSKDEFIEAIKILKQLGRVPIVYQGKYSLLDQNVATEILPEVATQGCGFAAFSPLAQGLLSNKYLNEIPADSRASSNSIFLTKEQITPQLIATLQSLNDLAQSRQQTLAQMALSWLLSDTRVTTVVMGASRASQIDDAVKSIENIQFTDEERALLSSLI